MNPLLRVIDFETTGFPPNAGIVEVGWTDVTYDTQLGWVVGKTFSGLTNPGIPIEIGAMAVHHIHQEDLFGKPDPQGVLARLDSQNVSYWVAHNAEFERKFFRPSAPWICTMKAAKRKYPEAPSHSNQNLRYWLHLDCDRERSQPAHRAGPDTYVTAMLLVHLLEHTTPEALAEVADKPVLLHTARFGKYKGKLWSEIDKGYLRWLLTQQPDPDVKYTCQYHLGLIAK